FEKIIDFLNANPIKYALTVNPIIYTSCIKQLWATAKVNTVNGEEQIQALVDKKKVIITKASVKSDFQLENDEGLCKYSWIYKLKECSPSHTKKVFVNIKRQGKNFSRRVTPLFPTMMVQAQQEVDEGTKILIDTQQTPTIFETTTSQPQRKQKTKKPKRKSTELPQTSVPIEVVADRAVYKEMYDNYKDYSSIRDWKLKKKAKKLEKKASKRTHKLKRLYKIGSSRGMESSDEASLGDQEDASKQRRIIDNLNANEGVTLVDETQERNDQDMFDTGVFDDEEVIAEKEVSTADLVTTAVEVVTTVSVKVSIVATTPTISMDHITLAKELAALKSAKPMVKEPSVPKTKGIVMKEPEETIIRTTTVPS
nr:hypothetical protein [Tanacetum cinerariifolium]